MNKDNKETIPWWQSAVFYQIYPKSFQDSNHDGIGDINGIVSRLPYLHQLGIDAIWLSPVYSSPNVDNGYDIDNYYAILNEFGTMADVEQLITKAKSFGIRIIMDLVVNHTSDQHSWFLEAEKGNKKYQDYYIWQKEPPNTLQSFFGGTAWTFNEKQNRYYLHLFSKHQPDLNWENPNMRKEIWEMMRFWIDKGIGGFRLDVIDLIGKQPEKEVLGNGPNLHTYLQEMYHEVLKETDLVTIGEAGSVTPETAPLYTAPERNELSMVFQFQHMALDEQTGHSKWALKKLSVAELKKVLSKWQTALPENAWNSLFWSNHDQPRILSRWGDLNYPLESGKMLAILLHLMRGTPFIYQGEEIGMTNFPIHSAKQIQDIESLNFYHSQQEAGIAKEKIFEAINTKGRDNARTPMQWDDSLFGGFSTVSPWYPINPNHEQINVEANLNHPNSLFFTYQKLIALRKKYPIIIWGNYELLDTPPTIFAYKRNYEHETWLVCANFSDQKTFYSFSEKPETTIISNYDATYSTLDQLNLRPYETFVVKLTP
ncbi:alpha-glucosidase [Enterococcus sp. C50]|uniref:alpha-glucosidase n=1 Tax=Enterococcus sp. C50 TaxID=3231311 RepID=UPI00349FE648